MMRIKNFALSNIKIKGCSIRPRLPIKISKEIVAMLQFCQRICPFQIKRVHWQLQWQHKVQTKWIKSAAWNKEQWLYKIIKWKVIRNKIKYFYHRYRSLIKGARVLNKIYRDTKVVTQEEVQWSVTITLSITGNNLNWKTNSSSQVTIKVYLIKSRKENIRKIKNSQIRLIKRWKIKLSKCKMSFTIRQREA